MTGSSPQLDLFAAPASETDFACGRKPDETPLAYWYGSLRTLQWLRLDQFREPSAWLFDVMRKNLQNAGGMMGVW